MSENPELVYNKKHRTIWADAKITELEAEIARLRAELDRHTLRWPANPIDKDVPDVNEYYWIRPKKDSHLGVFETSLPRVVAGNQVNKVLKEWAGPILLPEEL